MYEELKADLDDYEKVHNKKPIPPMAPTLITEYKEKDMLMDEDDYELFLSEYHDKVSQGKLAEYGIV